MTFPQITTRLRSGVALVDLATALATMGCGGGGGAARPRDKPEARTTTPATTTPVTTTTTTPATDGIRSFEMVAGGNSHYGITIRSLRRSGPFLTLNLAFTCVRADGECSTEFDFSGSKTEDLNTMGGLRRCEPVGLRRGGRVAGGVRPAAGEHQRRRARPGRAGPQARGALARRRRADLRTGRTPDGDPRGRRALRLRSGEARRQGRGAADRQRSHHRCPRRRSRGHRRLHGLQGWRRLQPAALPAPGGNREERAPPAPPVRARPPGQRSRRGRPRGPEHQGRRGQSRRSPAQPARDDRLLRARACRAGLRERGAPRSVRPQAGPPMRSARYTISVADHPTDLRVDVVGIRRRGAMAVLDLRMVCERSDSDDCNSQFVLAENPAGIDAGPFYNTAGAVTLVDPTADATYLAARNADDAPFASGVKLARGRTVFPICVYFAAPPPAVKTMTVAMPGGGPRLTGIPVE